MTETSPPNSAKGTTLIILYFKGSYTISIQEAFKVRRKRSQSASKAAKEILSVIRINSHTLPAAVHLVGHAIVRPL